ncbi:serine/threonine-protein kinase [Cryptosporangium phraense]|uniref:non-specific serine/threonine protein kinase n=1 Tax=Cryptosporangium phraense TaxID=2593070 RepID=A0A545ANK6_9ACTN|nr:serine/threonine-protein kinase [Cryptosporangium phraense]TQS42924.1 protein kinase [Cryptosporangium phraense]
MHRLPDVPGYELRDVLGSGGCATVYLATQIVVGRDVAVKVDNRTLNTERDQRRFYREVQAAGRLSDHPHVIGLYDAGTLADGRPYLVMELCTGGSLNDVLKSRGGLPAAEVHDLAVRLADALGAAHRLGVLHRDIKPANILVNRYGMVGLADFGLASILTADVEQSVTLEALTPAYAPPEAFSMAPPAPTGDVYSFGATLYALLNGRPPRFPDTGSPSLAAIVRMLDEPLPWLPWVPPPLMQVIAQAMAPSPAERFADGAAMYAALAQASVSASGYAVGTGAGATSAPSISLRPPDAGPSPHPSFPSGPPQAAAPSGPPQAAGPVSGPARPGGDAGAPRAGSEPPWQSHPSFPSGPSAGESGRHAAAPESAGAPPYAWAPAHRGDPSSPAGGGKRGVGLAGVLAGAAAALVVVALVGAGFFVFRDRGGEPGTTAAPKAESSGPATTSGGVDYGVETTTASCPAAKAGGRCVVEPECWSGMVVIVGQVTIERQPCDDLHRWETFAIAPLPRDALTSSQTTLSEHPDVTKLCTSAVMLATRRTDAAKRVPTAEWSVDVLPPSERAYADGSRVYRCVAAVISPDTDGSSGSAFTT